MFSQAPVCSQIGVRHPQEQTHPLGADTPPGSRLRHTVNERPVRILLECILVIHFLPKNLISAKYQYVKRTTIKVYLITGYDDKQLVLCSHC